MEFNKGDLLKRLNHTGHHKHQTLRRDVHTLSRICG